MKACAILNPNRKEVRIFSIYPFGAKYDTPAVKEIKITVEGGLTEANYKKSVKPRLEKEIKLLEKKNPGKSYWYCEK